MNKVIVPTIIELETNVVEVKEQYMKEQRSSPIILFGEKYMLEYFKVGCHPYPDLRKATIRLVRFEE